MIGHKRRRSGPRRPWLLAVFLVLPFYASAQQATDNRAGDDVEIASLIDDEKRPRQPIIMPYRESLRSSWALAIDNDILTPVQRDQDYTYGFNFTYTGSKAKDVWFSLDKPLSAVDRLLNVDNLSEQGIRSHHIEVGLFGFTPEDILVSEANQDDRPYASLIYLSSAREQLDFVNHISWKTTLTLGVLGSGIVGELQNGAHEILGGKEANGWEHQISDGGELTGRYSIARQKYLGTLSFGNTEVKSTLQASAGYLTEASWSLSIRSGHYHTLWSSFNPELASYGEKSTYTTSGEAIREHYFWAGISVKARAYNAFLQGQFRDSDVTYNRSELNPVLIEGWAGYTFAFGDGYRISYVLRGHSSEVKQGGGDRALVWGGLILAKTFP